MILGSRFRRDFPWYHILSGKIITFSLAVVDIYIFLKLLFNGPWLVHFYPLTRWMPSIRVNDILSDATDKIKAYWGRFCRAICDFVIYGHLSWRRAKFPSTFFPWPSKMLSIKKAVKRIFLPSLIDVSPHNNDNDGEAEP